jgi:hypothetical protein
MLMRCDPGGNEPSDGRPQGFGRALSVEHPDYASVDKIGYRLRQRWLDVEQVDFHSRNATSKGCGKIDRA